ncbi:MAG: hypothetical protein LBQ16_01870 [Gracilibacteraceae bacterium]|nr:hypothetical protein [Gracilibacteraceae bacterium]
MLLWREAPLHGLFSVRQAETVYRLSQELSGIWHQYASPAQAFREENQLGPDGRTSGLFNRFSSRSGVVLPSNADLRVVARQFTVAESWASRTARLVLESFSGRARVYLNGVRSENLIGEAEGYGGQAVFAVEATRLYFDRPNILIIEMENTSLRRDMPFGNLWPWPKHISGRVRIDSVPETIIEAETIAFDWRAADSLWVVAADLSHYQFMENGPWTVTGILSGTDGAEAARVVVPLETEGQYAEKVSLAFPLVSPRQWRPEDPYLYRLTLQVANSRGEQDSFQAPAGIAKIGTADGLWLVNGEAVPVQGLYLSKNDDFALRAAGLPDEWLAAQKQAGYNVFCFYESFPDETWFHAADRAGVGIWTALPVYLPASGPPDAADFQPMLDMAARHPSHWAWTAGTALPPGEETEEYLRELKAILDGKPLYVAVWRDEPLRTDGIFTLSLHKPLRGGWGTLSVAGVYRDETPWPLRSGLMRAGAIIWFAFLLFVGVQNIRARHWRFKDLSKRPRRAMRESCFWRYAAFFLRMATISGSWLILLYQLPLDRLALAPFDLDWITDLRRQPFFLLWVAAAAIFAAARLMQVGIGAGAFPDEPEAMGLVCWLERRYALLQLTGLAWILVAFGFPLFLPFAVYYGLELLLWPLRLRDVRKAGGSNFLLLVFPLTAALVFIIIIVSQGVDYIEYFLRR